MLHSKKVPDNIGNSDCSKDKLCFLHRNCVFCNVEGLSNVLVVFNITCAHNDFYPSLVE